MSAERLRELAREIAYAEDWDTTIAKRERLAARIAAAAELAFGDTGRATPAKTAEPKEPDVVPLDDPSVPESLVPIPGRVISASREGMSAVYADPDRVIASLRAALQAAPAAQAQEPLARLRDMFIGYRDAAMPSPGKYQKGSKIEVATIRKTLNVVVSEIDKELAAVRAPSGEGRNV